MKPMKTIKCTCGLRMKVVDGRLYPILAHLRWTKVGKLRDEMFSKVPTKTCPNCWELLGRSTAKRRNTVILAVLLLLFVVLSLLIRFGL